MSTAPSPPKIARLPEAVVVRCFSPGDSTAHARCARVCAWFRRIALVAAGFPEAVRIDTRHVVGASTAMSQMRPSRLLELRVSTEPTRGVVRELPRHQTQVAYIRVAALGCGQKVDMLSACAVIADGKIGGDGALVACERLDLQLRSALWHGWLLALLRRLPSLVWLELREFPEIRLNVLQSGAPQLRALHIGDNVRPRVDDVDGDWTTFDAAPDDLNFPHNVLTAFGELRHLALPYARVMYRDLLAASVSRRAASLACRLESLEVRMLSTDTHPARHTLEHDRQTAATRMTKLTRLVDDLAKSSASSVLARLTAVCCGRIGFRSDDYGITISYRRRRRRRDVRL
jgi:hypothetical protein